MKFTATSLLSSFLLVAAASASGGWEYTFHVDCHIDGEHHTGTGNYIQATFYDSSGEHITESSANNGIYSCDDEDGQVVSEVSSWDKWDSELGWYEMADRIRSVSLEISGDDAVLIDRVWLKEKNFHSDADDHGEIVMSWGTNDEKGWCMSTDPHDYKNNDWRENVPAKHCFSALDFEANGKVYGTLELR